MCAYAVRRGALRKGRPTVKNVKTPTKYAAKRKTPLFLPGAPVGGERDGA